MDNLKKDFHSGFVAVVGRTNVGKSTLMNTIMGQKLTIVSDRPQTTRNNIRLIKTTPDYQMVFIDTPGFHRPKNKLSSFMVESAGGAVADVDVVLFIVEEDIAIGKGDEVILEKLRICGIPVILLINKIDKVPKEELLKKIALYQKYPFINEIIPISALKNENVDELLSTIEKYLPIGPMFFPEDMVTDRAEKFIVGETIREKALRFLKEEIPHGIAVEIDSMKERPEKEIIDIDATIFCERNNHKAIIIGKNGAMLKRIGTSARHEIEEMLFSKVNLTLWVKVREGWMDKQNILEELGYTQQKDL